jgi:hypothetical protein
MDRVLAKAIVHKLGSSGTPPEFGLEHFSIGLEPILSAIEEEYLKGILKMGLSSFKIVTGSYGGGKTHFLYSIRDRAWKGNYVVSYVSLNPTECPFDKLELVYKAVMTGLSYPMSSTEMMNPWEKGIEPFLRKWATSLLERSNGDVEAAKEVINSIRGCESSSFGNALRGALNSILQNDEDGFQMAIQWLKGEEIPFEWKGRFLISERIEKTTAFRMIRSLIQAINQMGFSGVIFLFDEAERGLSIYSARDKRRALDNLRQLVDECGNARLPGAMIFYAIPDENLLLSGSGGVYEALKQRLRSSFTEGNPLGVKINLENIGIPPEDFLKSLGNKLADIFEIAYDFKFDRNKLKEVLNYLTESSLEYQFDVSYRRIFVISAIEVFQRMRKNIEVPITKKEAKEAVIDAMKLLTEKAEEDSEEGEY